MRRLIADEWLTLDGVAQAPGAQGEDDSGGFAHGGWHMRYADPVFQQWVVENLDEADGLLLGRRTYESFAGHWPNAPDEEQALARPLNELPKYVASRTLEEPLGWQNSTLLEGDAVQAVAALKQRGRGDIHVIGSTDLLRSLVTNDLVDEFRVIIDPVVVGGGKRIFPEDGSLRPMELLDSRVTTTGALIAKLAVAGR
jgi:dihydrofolate reductase